MTSKQLGLAKIGGLKNFRRDRNILRCEHMVDAEEPQEPKLNIVHISLIGVLSTINLALPYFRRQNALNKGDPLDQALVYQGSLAG